MKFSSLFAGIAAIILLVSSKSIEAQSDDQWWFDIEVIVFKRQLDSPLSETFEPAEFVPSTHQYDLRDCRIATPVSSAYQRSNFNVGSPRGGLAMSL